MLREEERQSDLVYALRQYWWVLLFISFTFSGFMYATSSQKRLAEEIQTKIQTLQFQKNLASEEQGFLKQKIESRDDPDFIMMTLIKVVGVTPKGQKKVIFDRID